MKKSTLHSAFSSALLGAALLAAPGIFGKAPSPALISDFEGRASKTRQGGQVLCVGPATALSGENSPFAAGSAGLSFKGQGGARLLLELVRSGASQGGPNRRVDSLSPSQSLSFSYRAAAGQRFEIRLVNTVPAGNATYVLEAHDSAWHELSIGFPPLSGDAVFSALTPMDGPLERAGAIEIVPLSSGNFELSLDDLRFDPPAYANSAAEVAEAMGTSLERAVQARSLGLPEEVAWALMRMAEAGGRTPAEVYELRKTKSWGDMAVAMGLDWAGLLEDMATRAQRAGLQAQEPTPEQQLKSLSNSTEEPGGYVRSNEDQP